MIPDIKTRVRVLESFFNIIDDEHKGDMRKVADASDVTYEAMRRWRHGHSAPRLDLFQDACDSLDFDIVLVRRKKQE